MPAVAELAKNARTAKQAMACAPSVIKNTALLAMADALWEKREQIFTENNLDLEAAGAGGMKPSLLDRLTLTPARLLSAVEGVRQVAALEDPVGQEDWAALRPNGLRIHCRRVPLGVVGIIYEARPNVTVDAAALCIKSGNACLLRGGKEALRTNTALANVMREAISARGLPANAVNLCEDPSRASAEAMMRARGLIDVLIPRGGAGLIRSVVENACVPVIETGVGICHVYVDESADLEMAREIVYNAKCSRPSVCNAEEVLLVHRSQAARFLPMLQSRLAEKAVELRCDPESLAILKGAPVCGAATQGACTVIPAGPEDFQTEFLDYILAVKVVGSLEEAMAEIAAHGTGHSEAIVTENYTRACRFTEEVDAAAVYVNASTRFTDGAEFGLGGEIGISTQKLHARGPMGLHALTSIKYVIDGQGQIR